MLHFKKFTGDLFHILFPDCCNACGTELYHGEKQICLSCLFDLPFTDFQYFKDNAVAKLFWGRIYCDHAMAMLYFRKAGKVQRLIHQLKYKAKTDLGFTLGILLGERMLQSGIYQHADMIIPVPLHPAKEKSRGYNQCKFIADGIAYALQVPVNSNVLFRRLETSSQTKKSRYNRYENMRSVFEAQHPEELAGKHVIVVDDVITTGATLEACGEVLLANGISKLSIVALAFTE